MDKHADATHPCPTPRTDAALDGWTDDIIRQSRLIPADAYAKVRDLSRQLERELDRREKQLIECQSQLITRNTELFEARAGVSETRLTVDEVKGHAGKPVAAPCALSGCQLGVSATRSVVEAAEERMRAVGEAHLERDLANMQPNDKWGKDWLKNVASALRELATLRQLRDDQWDSRSQRLVDWAIDLEATASATRAHSILTYTDEELCEMHRAVGELAMACGNPAVCADGDKTIESETIRFAAQRLREYVNNERKST